MLSHFSRVQLFAILWAVAHQAPLCKGFSRQEYLSGLPCSPPIDLSNSRIKPVSFHVSCIGRRVLYHQCHLEKWWIGINWEYGINSCTLLYINQINNQICCITYLCPFSMHRNYDQYLVINYNGKDLKKEYIHTRTRVHTHTHTHMYNQTAFLYT